ncbi:hypothetical protein ACRXCV_00105 (plasmid) [Halobacteriovorax sp. GFR7]|uniref:hypothetical protein n=1 Tax=unclassified Halobacteriovorax TaxID=2639665 RepID=UPI003D988DEC
MTITYTNNTPIRVALPKKQGVRLAPDNETQGNKLIETQPHDSATPFAPINNLFDDLSEIENNYGVSSEENITCLSNVSQPAPTAQIKKAGMDSAKARSVPTARVIEYGGEVYPSLTKCLKSLGLCRDRFKYLKRTRKELRSDKAIIGIMVHERRQEAMQGTSYVIAIRGEVAFEKNLTAACTRVNQIMKLPPKEALTQGQVSKYRYEWNKRPINRERQITLYEAFTSCLARLLVRHHLLEEADKAIFKARMSVVANELNKEQDLFDIVGEDDSHLEALNDLATQYHKL